MVFLPFSFLATVSLFIWLYILFDPVRPWDFLPVGDDDAMPELPAGTVYPNVSIIVPARNEADSLPKTLPALLSQDYPGEFRVILVDDRSSDGTAEIARSIANQSGKPERLIVLTGAPLPRGWTGKVWALDQGVKAANPSIPDSYFLLTDADILHSPSSLKRLVSESLTAKLGLNSRMARLRCNSPAERLLVPAFVFFFNLLYPMRKVNRASDKMAAAAGGCVLLSEAAIDGLGRGFESIRGEIIDDVNLGRQVKRLGLPIRLSLSRSEVLSLREYPVLGDIWRMVRRTAFTELKYSWLLLAGAQIGLVLLFVIPPAALVSGVIGAVLIADSFTQLLAAALAVKGLLALIIMRTVYTPAVRFFELPGGYKLTLPWCGVLYGLMTLDSACRHAAGKRLEWRNSQGPV